MIKNYLRSSLVNNKLTYLSILNINTELLKSINNRSIIGLILLKKCGDINSWEKNIINICNVILHC